MKKLTLTIALLGAMFTSALADKVTPEKAEAVASRFLNSVAGNPAFDKSGAASLKLTYTGTFPMGRTIEPAYYIFERSTGQGFVIVAGDDAVEPIIGYSLENPIDVNNLPPALIGFLKGHESYIRYVKTHPTPPSSSIQSKWSDDASQRTAAAVIQVIVEPLIKTRWNQGDPYNALCPSLRPTGCVATTMAQIMRYWNFPATGQGSHSYKPADFPTQSANFGATTYDWKSMTNTYSSSSSSTSKAAVALIMYHCGVSVDMGYSLTGGSGSTIYKAASAYKTYFRYTSNPAVEASSDNTVIGFRNKLIAELNNFRPVEMRGGSEVEGTLTRAAGHAWVCDGYDNDNAFHMNWGWGGSSDGYFKLSDLSPGGKDFSNDVKIIISLEKPNRKTVSSISSNTSMICNKNSFTCSVTADASFATYLWTVPSGWSVSGVVSTGVPISGSNSVTILPANSFDPTGGGSVPISVSGLTSYGERTPAQTRSIPVGTGTPTVIHLSGSTQHSFIASTGVIQHSSNGTSWTTDGNIYKVNVPAFGAISIYIRATYTCGTSASVKYTISASGKISMGIDEEESTKLVLSPNPVMDVLFIQSEKQVKSLKCFNALGQEMNVILTENHIPVSTLPKGVYFLNLVLEDEQLIQRKFVKE